MTSPGKNRRPTFPNLGRLFFPQSKALGLGVDEELSPAVMRKTVHLGTKLGSFASAAESVAETLEIELTTKRVERWTERIGQERVTERKLSVAEWESLPLVAKLLAPKGIKAPAVACVSCDGGRLQLSRPNSVTYPRARSRTGARRRSAYCWNCNRIRRTQTLARRFPANSSTWSAWIR